MDASTQSFRFIQHIDKQERGFSGEVLVLEVPPRDGMNGCGEKEKSESSQKRDESNRHTCSAHVEGRSFMPMPQDERNQKKQTDRQHDSEGDIPGSYGPVYSESDSPEGRENCVHERYRCK